MPRCDRASFHEKAREVYRTASPVTRAERRDIRYLVRCHRSARSRRIVRFHLARYKRHHKIRVQWAYYKAHPMPYCTFANESGPPSPRNPEWSGDRYRAKNSTSTAGGKYQIIDSTWFANGGSYQGKVRHPAAYAPPLEQERVGRNVLASQGIDAWVGCH